MMKKSLFILMIMVAASIAQPPQRELFTIDPARPTTADTIRFQMFDSNGCCCAAYLYDSVLSVSDTTIILYFKANYDPCNLCDCALLGRWLPYKTAPLRAGTYGVYRLHDPCYPRVICPDTLVRPVRIGQIVVTAASGVIKTPSLSKSPIILKEHSSAVRFNAKGEVVTSVKAENRNVKGVFFVKNDAHSAVTRKAIIK
jgi:hypothetical protein